MKLLDDCYSELVSHQKDACNITAPSKPKTQSWKTVSYQSYRGAFACHKN